MTAEKQEAKAEEQEAQKDVEQALEAVDSPQYAERVLDAVEQIAGGVTEDQAAKGAASSPVSGTDAVAQSPAPADSELQAAATLTAVAAESVAAKPSSAPTLQGAQKVFSAEAHAQRLPPKLIKPRSYLRQAVLDRMSPFQAWDAWLFIAVNRLPHSGPSNAIGNVVTIVATGGICWMVATALAWMRGSRRAGAALAVLVPSVSVATWIIEHPIKTYFRRRRPFIDVVRALVIGKKPGSWSFPSGHTAASFGSARVLSTFWPEYRSLFYGAAALVGFSRIYLGAHYPGDVTSGAATGLALTELARRALLASGLPLPSALNRRQRLRRRIARSIGLR